VSDAERLWQSINTKRAFRDIILPVEINGEQRWWLLGGKPILIGNSGFAGYRGVGADIPLKKQADDRLSDLVLHDALTDLPNRVSFQQSLSRAIAELRDDEPFALFFLDLDEFKAVNDTMGHGAGDKPLQSVVKRFSQCLGPGPVLARLAGDEFAVLLRGPQAQDRSALEALSDRLFAAIGQPFQIDDRRVNIGVSLGIAVAPEDGSSEIMRRADLALFQSMRQNAFRVDAKRGEGICRSVAETLQSAPPHRR
jgi:diguanylate cyclase (GGDEF)-like protein